MSSELHFRLIEHEAWHSSPAGHDVLIKVIELSLTRSASLPYAIARLTFVLALVVQSIGRLAPTLSYNAAQPAC